MPNNQLAAPAKTKADTLHITEWVLAALFVLSLLPLLYIGRYNFAAADDYIFCLGTHAAWQQTGSLAKVAAAAVQNSVSLYNNWQGTYAGVFFMNFAPMVFDYRLYKLVPFLMLALLIGSTFYLSTTLRKCFFAKEDAVRVRIATYLLLLCSIQFVPSPVESFYWFNGAFYYTGFYSLMLFYLAGCLRLCFLPPHKTWKLTLQALLLAFAAFLLGGANFSTTFFSCGLSVLLLVMFFIHKCPRKYTLCMALFTAVAAAGFLCSALAPGNGTRMEVAHTGAVSIARIFWLIWRCFYFSVVDAIALINPCPVLFILCAAVLFWPVYQRLRFRFPLPGIVLPFMLCVFATGYVAPMYAYNGVYTGPGRLKAILFYQLLWTVLLQTFYFCGWLHRVLAGRKKAEAKPLPLTNRALCAVCLALLAATMLLSAISDPNSLTTATAVQSLRDGTAAEYGAHMGSLVNQCLSPNVPVPTVTAFTNRPRLLWFDGPSTDPENACNLAMAGFYGKEAIVITDEG